MRVNKNREMRLGEERKNNFGSLMRISVYRTSQDIDVYFPEYNWTREHCRYTHFCEGCVACPYEPRVYNIGFLGVGDYNYLNAPECYNTWHGMLERCYDDDHRYKHPTYNDCYVCDEWLNFQNFAEWYYLNFYKIEGERMNLDKDILYKGNKIYSPETCVFVPQRINCLFIKSDSIRGDEPIGTSKKKTTNGSNIWTVNCHLSDGSRSYLGSFKTKEEAFNSYKLCKEKVIKEVADEYVDIIPNHLYNAMYNYEVEIDD